MPTLYNVPKLSESEEDADKNTDRGGDIRYQPPVDRFHAIIWHGQQEKRIEEVTYKKESSTRDDFDASLIGRTSLYYIRFMKFTENIIQSPQGSLYEQLCGRDTP